MKTKRLVAVFGLLIGLVVGIAKAQNFCFIQANPVLPPVGFGVQDSGINGSGYYPFDLATSAAANWAINASSNPDN